MMIDKISHHIGMRSSRCELDFCWKKIKTSLLLSQRLIFFHNSGLLRTFFSLRSSFYSAFRISGPLPSLAWHILKISRIENFCNYLYSQNLNFPIYSWKEWSCQKKYFCKLISPFASMFQKFIILSNGSVDKHINKMEKKWQSW